MLELTANLFQRVESVHAPIVFDHPGNRRFVEEKVNQLVADGMRVIEQRIGQACLNVLQRAKLPDLVALTIGHLQHSNTSNPL